MAPKKIALKIFPFLERHPGIMNIAMKFLMAYLKSRGKIDIV